MMQNKGIEVNEFMKTKIKPMPLQKEWEERKRLKEEGDKLCEEGWKLWNEGEKLVDEARELYEEGCKLYVKGNTLWGEAVIKYYGKDVKVKWRTWNEDNKPTCHINGDVYV